MNYLYFGCKWFVIMYMYYFHLQSFNVNWIDVICNANSVSFAYQLFSSNPLRGNLQIAVYKYLLPLIIIIKYKHLQKLQDDNQAWVDAFVVLLLYIPY